MSLNIPVNVTNPHHIPAFCLLLCLFFIIYFISLFLIFLIVFYFVHYFMLRFMSSLCQSAQIPPLSLTHFECPACANIFWTVPFYFGHFNIFINKLINNLY